MDFKKITLIITFEEKNISQEWHSSFHNFTEHKIPYISKAWWVFIFTAGEKSAIKIKLLKHGSDNDVILFFDKIYIQDY